MSRTAFSAILIVLAGGCISQPAITRPKAASVTKEGFAACFNAQAKLVPFSGVALARHADQSFSQTAGFLDPDDKVTMPGDARFRLASVQKVITRTAIGLLVDQGKVRLDAAIGTYITALPTEVAAITVDQLLQHRSGLTSFTSVPEEARQALRSARNSREIVPIIVAQPLAFRPGEREQYSNGGYYMLGAIIETVTGKDYGDYLQEALFAPLGMTSTSLLPDARSAVRKTKDPQNPNLWVGIYSPQERPGTAAGDGVSTSQDLTKLGTALAGNRLLSPETKARIFPRRSEPWRIGQSGGTRGTNTDFSVYPETGWVVTVLANYDPPAGELMGEVLRTYVLGKGCTPLSAKDRTSPMQNPTAAAAKPAT